jgi:AcrR family transcriptional regulator
MLLEKAGDNPMATPLDKARRDPASMKARILAAARTLFGRYGYHGATTRMIARQVGIDISTLHYHWGEKRDLYEAVITDLDEELRGQLAAIEAVVHGRSLRFRLEVAIERMADWLFAHPEISHLVLQRYFSRTRDEESLEQRLPLHLANIALAMGLASDREDVPPEARARVLAVWHSIFNFVSGEKIFRPLLASQRDDYIRLVKETLKFILVPAFAREGADPPGPAPRLAPQSRRQRHGTEPGRAR